MRELGFWLLPVSAVPLLLMVGLFAAIFRAGGIARGAFGLAVIVLLGSVLGEFVGSWMQTLPLWGLALFWAFIIASVAMMLGRLILGREILNHVLGDLISHGIRRFPLLFLLFLGALVALFFYVSNRIQDFGQRLREAVSEEEISPWETVISQPEPEMENEQGNESIPPAPHPVFTAGDIYEYQTSVEINGALQSQGVEHFRIRKVKQQCDDHPRADKPVWHQSPCIEVQVTDDRGRFKADWIFAQGWNPVRIEHSNGTTVEYNRELPLLDFELTMNKTWSLSTDETEQPGGMTRTIMIFGELLGKERVVTAAETFDAHLVHLDLEIKNHDQDTRTFGQMQIWYAETVNAPVRIETEEQQEGTDQVIVELRELIRYQRGAAP